MSDRILKAVEFIAQTAFAAPAMTEAELGAAMARIARQCEAITAALASAPQASLPPQGAVCKHAEQVRKAFAKIHPIGDEVPGALREAFFELFRQGWSAASDYYGIVVDGFGPPDARGYIDRIKQSDRASPLPAPQKPAKWHGLTEGERDKIVGDLIEYGTEFVAPLYAVVEGIERVLERRNAAPAPDSTRGTP